MLSKVFLFFPSFFPLSSTIISKAETSGTLTKSLKNTSIFIPSLFNSKTWFFKKLESYLSSSVSGKGMHNWGENSKGGKGSIFLNSSAAS